LEKGLSWQYFAKDLKGGHTMGYANSMCCVASEQRHSSHRHKVFTAPYSENDILYLQELFMSNGIHHISVPDIAAGRNLIEMFLSSLNCFYDIAYFGSEPHTHTSYFDVLAHLKLYEKNAADLDEFFINEFYFDFMWLEQTPHFSASPRFTNFMHKLAELKVDQHLPIIILSYQKS